MVHTIPRFAIQRKDTKGSSWRYLQVVHYNKLQQLLYKPNQLFIKNHRGQWHGDVFIYTFDSYNQHNLNCFWQEVAQLCLIRHENVMLFMGTCIDTSHLAVITR